MAVIGVSAAQAAGGSTWTAYFMFDPGSPFSKTYYASQTYPTKAQAIAAAQALDPYAGDGPQLTHETVVSMSTNSITYMYTAQAPLSYGTPYYCWQDCSGTQYASEAAADAVGFVQYWGSCTFKLTATSAWVDNSLLPAPWDTSDVRTYQEVVTCGPPPVPNTSNGQLIRNIPVSCPTFDYDLPLALSGEYVPPLCLMPGEEAFVVGTLNECPSNGSPSTAAGDPCDVSTGDFSQTESDYSGPALNFQRFYHSATLESHHGLGVGWTHNYAGYLVITSGTPTGLMRPDGHHDALVLSSTSGVYISLSGAGIHLEASRSNWIAYLKDGTTEIYSSTGQLQQIVTPNGLTTTLAYNSSGLLRSVSDAFGHSLQFSYNSSNQISTLYEPDGSKVIYGYDSNNNLTTATYPDTTYRTYQYQDSSYPHNLTGILDEQKQELLTVGYDPTTGAAVSSYQGGSTIAAQAVNITYSATSAVFTDALGATHTYGFTSVYPYSPRANSLSVNGQTQSFKVPSPFTDQQQRVTQYTDANNNITTYAYDYNHMTSKTEASGSAVARTTKYPTYQDTLTSLPTLVVEPLRQTAYAYYANTYQLHTKTITDTTVTPNVSRTWTYTYTSSGQVHTIDGPRTDVSDVTTYSYYSCATGKQCGQIETVKDALGHVTTFNAYNGHGQPLTITDPNGVVTTLTYDARQRVLSSEVGADKTSYSYWPTGLLKEVKLPAASTVSYAYDAAHRLKAVTDGLGNYMSYTLDAMGNRKAEKSYDPSGALHRSHIRIFNALNELYQDINAAGTAAVTTTYGYDNNHNLTSTEAPLARNTSDEYDSLSRVSQITDANNGVSKFGYDANNTLTSVLDPRSLTTGYTNDGFGEVTEIVSPDTGRTIKSYDSAGNLKTTIDARGALATYTYDALNRMTQVAYADETIKYSYDTGADGIGHLTGASDANHSMSWTYNAQGRVTGKGQTVGSVTKSVGYGYTNDELTSIKTPSGQTVVYGYTNHQIDSISVNGTTVLSGVTYDPFGPATAWTWGNSSTMSRSYTEDGNPNQIIAAGVTNTYTVDDASRITGISDSGLSGNTYIYKYDLLDRVKTGTSSSISRGYTYDANSNRLTETGTVAYSEAVSTSNNQIDSTSGGIARTYSYDSAGNTKSYTGATFTFNDRGRMSSAVVSGGTTDYVYNALGQLIEKSGYDGTTILVYDEPGHVLGEYSSAGALIQETVWLGDIPVATLRPNGSSVTIYYVHPDHLGTPRKITNPSDNTLVWRWDPDTFGSVSPSVKTIAYNLRFPGQYYLPETGLYHNYFRDYDPSMGRYVESDPIGLGGGNYSTYGYANENPISFADPLGLYVKLCSRWLGNSKTSATSRLNPIRHDYLDVSGQFLGFYSAPGANPAWGQGVVAGQNEQDGGRCTSLCNDNKFDAYVLTAAQEVGAPTYCAIASAEFGLSGLAAEAAGARNCQSWARDVIAKAKQNYLAHENCPTCFKK